VGREGLINGQTAEVTLNQLYGGQEKFALVEVEVAPGGAGTGREIARATATFEDAGTEHAVTLTMRATARFSDDRDAVVGSANLKVQADYAANAIAVAKNRAVALADAGRRTEAAAVLRAQAQQLDTMGNTYHNGAVLTISAANGIEADRLGRDGLDNATRKDYRTDAANTTSQQANGRNGP
jgi:Ca-activated chloride channel family protein